LAIGPNFAGISIFLLPLCCALPISIGLLTFLKSRNKNKGPLGLLLPGAGIPGAVRTAIRIYGAY
jgi:hypothetical protein